MKPAKNPRIVVSLHGGQRCCTWRDRSCRTPARAHEVIAATSEEDGVAQAVQVVEAVRP